MKYCTRCVVHDNSRHSWWWRSTRKFFVTTKEKVISHDSFRETNVFKDLLKNSLKSFDFTVWSVVVIVVVHLRWTTLSEATLHFLERRHKRRKWLRRLAILWGLQSTYSWVWTVKWKSRSSGKVSSGFLWFSLIVTLVDLVFHGIRLNLEVLKSWVYYSVDGLTSSCYDYSLKTRVNFFLGFFFSDLF